MGINVTKAVAAAVHMALQYTWAHGRVQGSCSEGSWVATCRFQAVLSSRGGDAILQIVETNDFKQLPHISLAFRQGNDSAVKQVMFCFFYPLLSRPGALGAQAFNIA